MPYVFNPGYIGTNPPCCDPECTDENNCPDPECGPCPGPHASCGGCCPPPIGITKKDDKADDSKSCNDDTTSK